MYSVLLVDDEPLVVKGIRITLERSGLLIDDIREADDGEEAISLIAEKIPDILITDIRMPKIDGLELCRKIYKKCPDTRILIISGYDDFKYAQEAMKYGVREYLLKPVQKTELINAVASIIEEKENTEKPQYIAHKEMDRVINKLENGIWNCADVETQEGIRKLQELLVKAPPDHYVEIVNDVVELLVSKLSLKIGYTLKIQFPDPPDQNKENAEMWLNTIMNKLSSELKERKNNANYNLFEMAKQYIQDNFSSDITLEELARKTGFSPNYFSQLFKMKTGKTFVQFRSEIRITKAMELLARPDKTITEVAMDVGYNDLTYFIRAFKDYTGQTPNEYRRKRGL